MANTTEKNKIVGGVLYLVATPIGNLSDLSERAVKTLSEVDFIAAEDTRNSVRLLTYLDIHKPLLAYHEHNKREKGIEIIERIRGGESCALITDAGTPAISDPGEDLVLLCAEQNIPVTLVPGCCAAIMALTLSALPTGRFTFEGFLPAQKKERGEALSALKYEKRTMIFHEAPHKLRPTLENMRSVFGDDRRISLCRELTKLNEDIMRTTLAEAASFYKENEPRGEYVLVVEGTRENAPDQKDGLNALTLEEHYNHYVNLGIDKKEAIKSVARDRGVPKNEIYREVINFD